MGDKGKKDQEKRKKQKTKQQAVKAKKKQEKRQKETFLGRWKITHYRAFTKVDAIYRLKKHRGDKWNTIILIVGLQASK